MAIRAVTFDVGSTLLYPSPSVAETFVSSAREYGYDIPVEEAESHIDACWALYYEEYRRDGDFWCHHEGCKHIWYIQYALLCERCGVVAHKDDVVDATYRAFLRGHHWGIYEDVVETLRALQDRGVTLGVISNWDTDLLNILADLGLSRYFADIIPSALVGLRKPNPALFELALERLGVSPGECLHVGDADDADGEGPLAAGMHSLIIDRHAGVHAPGLTVIHDLSHVLDYV